jgi:outer membrane protein assembly factor BamB
MASVDYANDRVYFASHRKAGGSLNTLWSLDLSGAPGVFSLAWAKDLDDIDSSPVLSGGRVYVGSVQNGGTLHALDAATGGISPPPVPPLDREFLHNDGQVKGFVFPDRASGDLYFATDNFVWALNDDGLSITNNFAGGIPLAGGVVPTSAVLFIPGSTYVYVGGSDGKLYEIDVSGGTPVIRSVVVGDGLAPVGAPSLDWPNSLLHVGTEAGGFYAVEVPFP